MIGPNVAEINADRDDMRDIVADNSQIIQVINPNNKLIELTIPMYVATPFPPLNFNQIGKQCPMKTNRQTA